MSPPTRCRTGLSAVTVFVACCLVVANLRVLDAFEARAADEACRSASGLAPKGRRRRRKRLAELARAPSPP